MKEESGGWDKIVSRDIHEIKVAVLEAMLWVDEPFSPSGPGPNAR